MRQMKTSKMSAAEQLRALVDEYMGTTRNGGDPRIEFDHPRVCKSYLLDCCPNEIFSGTAFEHLQAFVRDSDRRTEVAKAKLRDNQEDLTDEASQKSDQINSISDQIVSKLTEAEKLGACGRVEESLKLMKEVEELNQEKAKNETDLRTAIPTSTYQQQKLRVCEVCSAYLGVHDNDRRLADHFGGKLHMGFIEVRNKLDDLKAFVLEHNVVRKPKPTEINRVTHTRETDRERERSRERPKKSRSRSRSRSRDRKRDRHRSSHHSKKHSRSSRRYHSSRDKS